MGALRLIIGLLVAVAVVSFGVLNMTPVSVTYHRVGTFELPLFYVILAFFAAGFLLAWLGGVLDRIKYYSRYRSHRRQIQRLEKELARIKEKSGRLLPASSEPDANGDASRALPAPLAPEPANPDRGEERNVPHN